MANEQRYYFTIDTENSILKYVASQDMGEKHDLYLGQIKPAFEEMIEKIVYTYKFNSLPNVEDLKEDCKLWLMTILDKFDISKNKKAFAYFSVITKNWFIHEVKRYYKKNKNELQYQSDLQNLQFEDIIALHENDFIKQREQQEFWECFKAELGTWDRFFFKDNEKKIFNAMKVLFDNVEHLEDNSILNKKAVYFYIKEITGLNTKQIASILRKFRVRYNNFKLRWDEGEI